jgi:hypothetical protein
MSDEKITSMSDNTSVAMPIRNIISIIGAVSVFTWAYSGVLERLNTIENRIELKAEAVKLNSNFRINWPLGTMGSLPADAKQNREIQALRSEIDRVMEEVEENDKWIEEFEPPKEVLEAVKIVRQLEGRVLVLETIINNQK